MASLNASMVLRAANYVYRSEDPEPKQGEPYLIVAIGRGLIVDALQQITKGKSMMGRPIRVEVLTASELIAHRQDLMRSQLLFLSIDNKEIRDQVLKAVAEEPVLTVSTLPGFAAAGGCMQLFEQDNKLRFELRADCLRKAGLRASSNLMRLSRRAPRK